LLFNKFRIHCSSKCREKLIELGGYILEERGFVNLKGNPTNSYFLSKPARYKSILPTRYAIFIVNKRISFFITFTINILVLIGKGDQLTYWLIGENPETRKIRVGRNLAGKYFHSQKSPMSGGSDHQLDLLFKTDLSSIRRESSKCGRSNGSRLLLLMKLNVLYYF
jgi:hypothetical protein